MLDARLINLLDRPPRGQTGSSLLTTLFSQQSHSLQGPCRCGTLGGSLCSLQCTVILACRSTLNTVPCCSHSMRVFRVHRESYFVLQHSNVVSQLIISFIYSGKAKTKNLLKGLTSANCPSIRWLGSVSPLIDLDISPVLPPYLPQQHQLPSIEE
ncbi:hypothetical protein BJX62DRAFT_217016 [Aspergillus germanicus]